MSSPTTDSSLHTFASCQHDKTRVVETRRLAGDVYRRRTCETCGHSFVTRETQHETGMPLYAIRKEKGYIPPSKKIRPGGSRELSTEMNP